MNQTQSTYLALMGIDRWQLRQPHLLPVQAVTSDLSHIMVELITAPPQPQWLVVAAHTQELGLTGNPDVARLWQAWWHAVGVTLADLAVGVLSTATQAQSLPTLLQRYTPCYVAWMGKTIHSALFTTPAPLTQSVITYAGKTATPVVLLPSVGDMLQDPLQKRVALHTIRTAQKISPSL
jgi:hypothetical protein